MILCFVNAMNDFTYEDNSEAHSQNSVLTQKEFSGFVFSDFLGIGQFLEFTLDIFLMQFLRKAKSFLKGNLIRLRTSCRNGSIINLKEPKRIRNVAENMKTLQIMKTFLFFIPTTPSVAFLRSPSAKEDAWKFDRSKAQTRHSLQTKGKERRRDSFESVNLSYEIVHKDPGTSLLTKTTVEDLRTCLNWVSFFPSKSLHPLRQNT